MKNFNFTHEIEKMIADKQLTEIRFREKADVFKVAYILKYTDECITLAEIDERGELDGVCMYRSNEVSSVSTKTSYLNKLATKTDLKVIEKTAKEIASVSDHTFPGFAAAFENTDVLVEVIYEADSKPVGKIVGHDEKALALLEFDENHTEPLSYTLIDFSAIFRMSLDIPYMRDITASLK